jgi:Lrp/AsnC family leucine-responsive transcriptional regulator
MKLDEIDRKILSELSRNAKISHRNLAKLCGTARQTVAARIKKLERAGAIKGYRAILDYEKVGYRSFFVLFLKLDTFDKELTENYIKSMKKDANVMYDASITGEWDVMQILAFEDAKDYENYINSLRNKNRKLIKDSKSHAVLRFYKTSDEYVPLIQ